MPGDNLLPDRLLIVAAVVLTCVLFTAEAADPVNVIKMTALLLVATALVASAVCRAVLGRIARVPSGAAPAAAAVLALALITSAVTAPVTTTAVLGAYGRNSGLLSYLAAIVLFVSALRVFTLPQARYLLVAITGAGLFTATYGLLQRAGIDAVAWNNPFNPIIAALGNPNFASGYLGISASVAIGGALWQGWGAVWRVASGSVGGLCLLTALLSSSVQGPIAAAGGLFVVGAGFALGLRSSLRRASLTVLGGGLVAGLVVLLLGTTKRGPAAPLFSDVGSEARRHYWGAALQMFQDRPLLGVGLDHYGNFWRTARSQEAVAQFGGGDYSDAAHSVPLQMLAQGGLALGLSYGAFVAVTLYYLLRGLQRLTGPDRQLLAALGGGWAAYQVQASVSIDQVPLIVLHFTLAGAVIATAGGSRLREVRLPGAPAPVGPARNAGRMKRRPAPQAAVRARRRPATTVDVVLLGLVATLAGVTFWQALDPLRANVAVNNGDSLRNRGDGTGAFRAYNRATELLPGEELYWIKKADLFLGATPPQLSQARAAAANALDRNPSSVSALRVAGAAAEQSGDVAAARHFYERLLRIDPLSPKSVAAAARFELRHGGAQRAVEILAPAVRALPDEPDLWAALGDARAVLGDSVRAEQAYERALLLAPESPAALEGLQKLQRAA